MKIIGRKRESDILEQCSHSGRPEFVVIYGRRRVGKTFLVREYFNRQFAFYATGIDRRNTKDQLKAFNDSLIRYGSKGNSTLSDWFDAFSRLRTVLENPNVPRDPVSGRRVVFLDEMPWMDTQRSDFRSALDYFWNSWGSAEPDLLLIACGSATSWIIDHLLDNKGGFYKRVTRRIHIMPFNLKECEQLLQANDIRMSRISIIECYTVFGGVPYYMNCLDRRLSLAQNIEELCFKEYGELRNEFDIVFGSLFKKPEKHIAIIRALAETKSGMTRGELAQIGSIGGGSVLTKDLKELEECGFIRKYRNGAVSSSEWCYQVVDQFTLFSIKILQNSGIKSWMEYLNSPGYVAWRGNAFEITCMSHIEQIKSSLRIAGVFSEEYEWRSRDSQHGAQIDLVIDRRDGIVNLCEMKFTDREFAIDSSYAQSLNNKTDVYRRESGTNKGIHLTMISVNGLKRNRYYSMIQSVITGEELFN